MSAPENYSRVKDIFLAARQLHSGDRTPFLAERCAGDPGLADQVRALLTLDEQAIPYLDAPALQAAGLAPGTRLGQFRIERVLGEGGMGIVYEAQQDEPSRRVALKIIRPGYLSARLRSRFRHEIRILGQLHHPGIAQIYEAGTLELAGDEVPYFAMELVSGRPLIEYARTLPVRERLALIAQVCDAVQHAHQKGVVHRDLKPGNILIEEASATDQSASSADALPFQVKVLDFGIARATDADIRSLTIQTDAGQLVGTLPYMSPEQATGDPNALDTRSDVYSIGVIAFELLAQRLPHALRGLPIHEAARILHDTEPTRLGAIDRSLRGDIETIIAKALEKDPAHRYQSAAELAADLRRYLRDEPIVARPASALYQLRKFARRHRTLVAAALTVFAAMAAATIVSLRQARIAFHARNTAESERTRANLSADAARREARRATLAATAAAIENGDPIAARRLLDGADLPSRGWAWSYWNARLDDSIAVFRPGASAVRAWLAPAGDRVVILSSDGLLASASPGDQTLTPGPTLPNSPVAAAFTADGARIIAIGGPNRRSLDEFNARDGSLIRHIADLPGRGVFVRASDNGAVIAVAVKMLIGAPAADQVWLYDGNVPGINIRPDGRTADLAITPDGRVVISGWDSANIWKASSRRSTELARSPRGEMHMALTSDGSRIALGGEDKTIRVFDRASPTASILAHAGSITALAFDATGSLLASAATDLTIRLWDPATGRPIVTLVGHTSRIRDLCFSADARRFFSTSDDGTVRVWTRDAYDSTCILRGHTNYVYAVAFTPDGTRIVSGAWDESVRLWDARSGRALNTFNAPDLGYITALGISPDGATIATARKMEQSRAEKVVLLRADNGEETGRRALGRGELHGMVFNRAGTRLYTAREQGGAAWVDLTTRPLTSGAILPGQASHAIALSPDETRVATGGPGGAIRIVDAATGAPIRDWTGQGGTITALAWCPTRPLLASASTNGTVRLWNPQTGAVIAKLDRHWDRVYCLAFSPDGSNLATGSEDTTIRIWDVDSGDELTQLRGHRAYVYSLAFSPDGACLVSGSGDSTVRVWDTRPVHDRWAALREPR